MARPEIMDETTELGAAIRVARGDQPRRLLSYTLGCTEKTIYEWEKGKRRPTAFNHIRALRDMGVPIELLLADVEAPVLAGSAS
jgi:DNA-binding XRE family transcriptional regulator